MAKVPLRMMVTKHDLSQWEHTSTAFGAGLGCNFKVRVAGCANGVDSAVLQQEAYRLSRLIDHRSLEKDIPFFKNHAPTLENIAQYLFAFTVSEKSAEKSGASNFIEFVEIDANAGMRARAGHSKTQILLNFSARNARRVFDIEVTVEGFVSPFDGTIIRRNLLEEALRHHFVLPEVITNLGQQDILLSTFSALKTTLLPRKLKSIVVRDATENSIVWQLHDHEANQMEVLI